MYLLDNNKRKSFSLIVKQFMRHSIDKNSLL